MSFNLEWVYLRIQPYMQLSLRPKGFNKLSPRFFGPFHILQKLGPIAYKLALSSDCLLHPIFDVSCLKKKLGAQITPIPTLPPVNFTSFLQPEPIAIVQHRSKQLKNRLITNVLVQWQGQDQDLATWESLYNLQHQFRHLVGKVF